MEIKGFNITDTNFSQTVNLRKGQHTFSAIILTSAATYSFKINDKTYTIGGIPPNQLTKIKKIFTVNSEEITIYPTLTTGVSVFEMMLEEGKNASTAVPAPEDIEEERQNKIAEVNSALATQVNFINSDMYRMHILLSNEINDVDNSLSGFRSYTNGAFKDGIIDQAESQAIEKYINLLNKEKLDVDKQYQEIYSNVELAGTPKYSLLNAKNSFNSAHSLLLSSVTNAISDSQISAYEKSLVDGRFNSYNTALKNLRNAFEVAIEAIRQSLHSKAKAKAQEAKNQANAAASSALSAQNTANSAQSSAASAQNTANSAQNSAANAQNTANSAQNSAANAQNTANTAQSKAQQVEQGLNALEQDIDSRIGIISAKTNFLTTIVADPNSALIGAGVLLAGNQYGANAGMSGLGSGNEAVRFFSGIGWQNRTSAPFRVLQSGKLYATNAEIQGIITATSGSIGGIQINNNSLGVDNSNPFTGRKVYLSNEKIQISERATSYTTHKKVTTVNSGEVTVQLFENNKLILSNEMRDDEIVLKHYYTTGRLLAKLKISAAGIQDSHGNWLVSNVTY